MSTAIGFVGLGVMGGPMAGNMGKKNFRVRIFDVDSKRLGLIAGGNLIPASDLSDLGASSDVVILSLPNSEVVKDVVLGGETGRKGLAQSLKPGSVIVDTSTTELSATLEIAQRLQEKEIEFLDAPMSGGEKAAIEGTLSFMVGGKPEIFERCRPFLEAMGASVTRVGPTGAGQTAKCVNQMIVGATFAVIAESFALGTRAGLDPKVLYEAIKGGWAGSKVLDTAARDMFGREFKPGGTVDIHWKDLGYALSLAKTKDVPTPVTALVHEVFKAARAAGHGKLSQPAVARLWESLLGLEIK
jgi:2-hydroxy-3-oxopropionate reductase